MEEGQIAARPRPLADRAAWPLAPGLYPLALGGARDGLLRVPEGQGQDQGQGAGEGPLPLILMLHGAGGSPAGVLNRIAPIADSALVVLPASTGTSWDVLEEGYGPDIARIDAALAGVFATWPVDPGRVAAAGFSDGASYALSLAMMNGALFTHALAFSPGFAAPVRIEGKPRLFLSHGTADRVLSIDHCSRRLVPKLKRAGYPLDYCEFEGGHEVPEAIARRALDWLLA